MLVSLGPAIGQNQPSGAISGAVLTADTRQGLPLATVLIAGTTIGTVTNEKGEFALTSLDPGEYTIHEMMCLGSRGTTSPQENSFRSLAFLGIVIAASRNSEATLLTRPSTENCLRMAEIQLALDSSMWRSILDTCSESIL